MIFHRNDRVQLSSIPAKRRKQPTLWDAENEVIIRGIVKASNAKQAYVAWDKHVAVNRPFSWVPHSELEQERVS